MRRLKASRSQLHVTSLVQMWWPTRNKLMARHEKQRRCHRQPTTTTHSTAELKFLIVAGRFRGGFHTAEPGGAEAQGVARIQTSRTRPTIGQHQHIGREDVLHTEPALRRCRTRRLLLGWERIGTARSRHQGKTTPG